MLKHFDFECNGCAATFSDYVEGVEGKPEVCVKCGSVTGFTKLPSVCVYPTTIVIDYPGSKRFKAGYQHTHARPAENKGSQVSMYMPKDSGK